MSDDDMEDAPESKDSDDSGTPPFRLADRWESFPKLIFLLTAHRADISLSVLEETLSLDHIVL